MKRKTLLYAQMPYGPEFIVHTGNPHFVVLVIRNEMEGRQASVPLDHTQVAKVIEHLCAWLGETPTASEDHP